MGKISVVLPDDVEDYLRDLVRGKGDISRIITEALVEKYKIPRQQREPIVFQRKEESE